MNETTGIATLSFIKCRQNQEASYTVLLQNEHGQAEAEFHLYVQGIFKNDINRKETNYNIYLYLCWITAAKGGDADFRNILKHKDKQKKIVEEEEKEKINLKHVCNYRLILVSSIE